VAGWVRIETTEGELACASWPMVSACPPLPVISWVTTRSIGP